jgi:mono/diheme cytochrome c family protein
VVTHRANPRDDLSLSQLADLYLGRSREYSGSVTLTPLTPDPFPPPSRLLHPARDNLPTTRPDHPMRRRHCPTLIMALLLLPAGARGQQPAIPKEVTDSTVRQGQEVFHGTGSCSACHGDAGVGTDSGPPIAKGVWLHGGDSYEAILSRVIHGVPKAYSLRGLAMPMRGWNNLSDDQVKAVAAYVWWISHPASHPHPRKRP